MTKHKVSFITHLYEVKYKLFTFIALILYFVLLFNAVLDQYRVDDPSPDVEAVGRAMHRQKFRHIAAKIRAGLHIENFPTFDFTHNTFVGNGLVWFEFNKNEVMLETVDKFSFDNGKIIKKSAPKVEVYGDKLVVRYNIVFETKTDLDFHRFPLEDHRLSIVLANNFTTPNEMSFDDDIRAVSLSVSKNLFTSNWDVRELRSYSGYSAMHFDEFNEQRSVEIPKAVFIIDFEKTSYKKILIIFIPIFAAVFFALFTFLMSFNSEGGKFALTTSAITALLGYRFVIQQLMPSVGYLTVTDKLYLFFLLFTFVIFIFQLLLVRQYMFLTERDKIPAKDCLEADKVTLLPRQTELINSIVYYISVIIFAVVVTYIIL